jgi:predicted NAD-dependent protein-ADP-ribosyltransferase YbiA (DUF1768 family)
MTRGVRREDERTGARASLHIATPGDASKLGRTRASRGGVKADVVRAGVTRKVTLAASAGDAGTFVRAPGAWTALL